MDSSPEGPVTNVPVTPLMYVVFPVYSTTVPCAVAFANSAAAQVTPATWKTVSPLFRIVDPEIGAPERLNEIILYILFV